MSEPTKCGRCDNPAVYRFFWIGREGAACAEHANELQAKADMTGLHLLIFPIHAKEEAQDASQ